MLEKAGFRKSRGVLVSLENNLVEDKKISCFYLVLDPTYKNFYSIYKITPESINNSDKSRKR